MAKRFAPYQAWLGIVSGGRPADHYQLLGLRPFESDPQTITATAEAQMSRVKPYLEGEHAEAAQRVIEEILAARNCLLRPESKARYDGQLLVRHHAEREKAGQGPQLDVTAGQSQSVAVIRGEDGEASSFSSRARRQSRPFWRSQFAQIAVGGVAGILVAVPLIVLLHSRGDRGGSAADAMPPPPSTANSKRIESAKIVSDASVPADSPDLRREEASGESSPPEDVPLSGDPAAQGGENAGAAEPVLVSDGRRSSEEDAMAAAGETASHVPATAAGPRPADSASESPEPKGEQSKPKVEAAKLSVPVQAEQDQAELRIRKLLHDEIVSATTSEQLLGLARKLIELAAEAEGDPTLRYVLLRTAEEQAIAACETSVALEAIDKMASDYDIDVWARKAEVPARVIAAVRRARGPVPSGEAIVEAAIALANQALREDRYPVARQIAETLLTAARRAKNAVLARQLLKWEEEIDRFEKDFAKVQTAQAVVAGDPSDAEANLTVGRWHGFVKGDWGEALPLLAKGSNADLAAIARQELAEPTEPNAKAELGRAWWQQCLEQTGRERSMAARHAVLWYDRALTKLTGVAELEAAKGRLEALSTVADPDAPDVVGAVVEGDVALTSSGAKVEAEGWDHPERLLDETWNLPASHACPAVLKITFPRIYRLQEIRLHLHGPGKHFYGYSLATSGDGTKFVPLVDRRDGTATGSQRYRFPVRPVRAVMLMASSGMHAGSKVDFSANEIECFCIPPDTVHDLEATPPSSSPRTFDFGTASSPVAAGYTQVTDASSYSPATGYGWLSGKVQSRDRETGSDLERDFDSTGDAVFVVDLPNGTYQVTVTMGDAWTWHDQLQVVLEGIAVETIATVSGQPVSKTYAVEVGDGQLTLGIKDVGGEDPFAVINALKVIEAPPVPTESHFDPGTASPSVEAASGQDAAGTVRRAAGQRMARHGH